MGGAHVFPGGRLDDADRLPAPVALCDGVDAVERQIPDLDPADGVAHHVGAIRELFEEAGVLLARPVEGQWPAETALCAERAALKAGTTSIGPIAQRLRLRLSCRDLVYFANWRTPESEVKRYDVRFFLARALEGQPAAHDGHETTETVWLDPDDAIAMCRREELLLAPPTWTTLRFLARYRTLEEALAWARALQPSRVQPRLFEQDGRRLLALPGDETYPPVEGFDTPTETRFHFDGKRWRPVERP